MVLFTVYGYGLLLRCDVMKRAERNTHSKATEEAGMHKICSLISKELAVQILSSGPLDPSMGNCSTLHRNHSLLIKTYLLRRNGKKDIYI